MFDTLSDRLGGVFDKLKGRGALREQDGRDAMREVRIALLEADADLGGDDDIDDLEDIEDIDEDGDSPDNDVDLGGDDDLGVATSGDDKDDES